MTKEIERGYYGSPIGGIEISVFDDAIVSICFQEDDEEFADTGNGEIFEQCEEELTEYFEGHRMKFDLLLAPHGTDFEKQVWSELLDIPYGKTCSYIDIANRMNNPKAIRAVGRANGANPIAIVIPCHRVVGADGSLTGYSGELWRKRWLLDHEARTAGVILL